MAFSRARRAVPDLTRERFEGGRRRQLVMAHIVRGAIHALAPQDFALYGRVDRARRQGSARSRGRQMQLRPRRFR
jgi:hypothetical protein